MKHLVRTALAALVSVTAATVALLPAGPASAAAASPAHRSSGLTNASILGTWVNNDPASKSIQDVVVTKSRSGVLVDVYGACVMSAAQTPCEWGTVQAISFAQHNAQGIDTTSGSSFRAEWSWNHGAARSILVADLMMVNGQPMMIIEEPRLYVKAPAMGPNWIVDEIFHLGAPMTSHKSGTTVTNDFPTGNLPVAMNALLGTWMNPAPNVGGIAKIVVSQGRNGSLNVHSWGACGANLEALCDWGTTYGVTMGDPGAQADEFIAPYATHGPHGKNTLLCAQIMDAAGDMLMNNEYTVYTDHGHAEVNNSANYTLDENFMKVS